MPCISVTKCHGTGNDFILLDARAGPELPYAHVARTLCRRRFAIGADGLLVVSDPHKTSADVAMRAFNPDGSEAEMCGNGVRCVARYLYQQNPQQTAARIETMAGMIETKIVDAHGHVNVQVAMGEPRFHGGPSGLLDRTLRLGDEIAPAYAVSMGNPHVVVVTSREPVDLDLESAAAEVQTWKIFDSPPNVELAKFAGDEIRMRVHERGVGETWACGTGACAAAAVAIACARATSPVMVTTKGGSVRIAWSGPGHSAVLTGDAELVFRTDVELPAQAGVAAHGR